nr:hypothetical protein [uncultured Roseococcus sp.]
MRGRPRAIADDLNAAQTIIRRAKNPGEITLDYDGRWGFMPICIKWTLFYGRRAG